MKIRIMLDSGHYGSRNRSPVVKEYYESRRMWVLCGYLKAALEGYGFEVGTTREDIEKDLAVTKRGMLAKGYDLFISLHSNAVGEGGSHNTNHISVYGAYDNLNGAWELGTKLAESVASVMGVKNSYLKTRKSEKGEWEYYGVLRGARNAGCPLYYIIEHSFHTNAYAAKWLLSDANLQKLAYTEAAVIAAYYGIGKPGDVNSDGVLDASDIALIKRIYLGTYTPDESEKAAADTDGDGEITARDYLLAKREFLAGENG